MFLLYLPAMFCLEPLCWLRHGRSSKRMFYSSNRDQVNDVLPNKVRDCQEIARRSLALFGVVGIALGSPRNDIIDWLKDEALWDDLSPTELRYVVAQENTEQQTILLEERGPNRVHQQVATGAGNKIFSSEIYLVVAAERALAADAPIECFPTPPGGCK